MPSAKNKVQPQKKTHEHELDTKGVYQLTNGTWAFRFCKSVKGKNVYKRASTDSTTATLWFPMRFMLMN